MTGNQYQELAARTIRAGYNGEQMQKHALFEMPSELGEVCGIFQKEMQGHAVDESKVIEEIGDLCWGIAEFCTGRGICLDYVFEQNIEKLRKRYPDGFSEERSVNRAQYEGGNN